jgi:hypothetical protein
MKRRYFEFDRTNNTIVVYEEEQDGDRAIDFFESCEFEELLKKYPDAVLVEFLRFIDEMEKEKECDE